MFEMSEAVGVSEFGFMTEVPSRKGKQSPLAVLAEMRRLSEEHGILVPSALSAAILGVSRVRVYELIGKGVLHEVKVGAVVMITERSLLAYASSERKSGRPPGSLGKKKLWEAAKQDAAELCKK